MLTQPFLSDLRHIVGDEHVVDDAKVLQHGSRDCYWFSPVLKPLLDDKTADVIVRPSTVDELRQIVARTVRERVPITLRGAGTGNYGQGIPLHGGVLVSTKRLDQILELTPEHARVEAGVVLNTIEQEARKIGAELRFYPSTLLTATAGGFLAGGAGGIGSITWGMLWDEGNVLAASALTIEEEPRLITATTMDEMQGIIHNCGVTCIIVDLTLALAPAQPWQQYVAAFAEFDAALRFGEALAHDQEVTKRLVTPIAWPAPSFFRQLVRQDACPEGESIVLLQTTLSPDEMRERVAAAGGHITWHSPSDTERLRLSDFSWNHTTLWAIKHDPQWTYLQDMFDPERLHEQLAQRQARFGDDLIEHIEFARFKGRLIPAGLTLVRFHSKAQIWALIDFCESIGIEVANPHTHRLDEDIRWNGQPILDAKARWDPHGLLNPGHLRALERQ